MQATIDTAVLRKDGMSGISWLEFTGKPAEQTRAALKANGWRWGAYRGQWYNNRRWARVPDCIEVEQGGECDYSAERAERLAGSAERHTQAATAASDRARSIANMIPFGQPILVGHHSERRHRRDIARITGASSKAVQEWRKAERLERAADSSARHQAHKEKPAVIARRIDRLKSERTAFLNQRSYRPGWAGRPEAEHVMKDGKVREFVASDHEKLAWYDGEIAKNQQLLADLGGLPGANLNVQPGDIVRARGYKVRVNSVSKKSFRGDTLEAPHLGEYFTTNRLHSITDITEVIERAAPGQTPKPKTKIPKMVAGEMHANGYRFSIDPTSNKTLMCEHCKAPLVETKRKNQWLYCSNGRACPGYTGTYYCALFPVLVNGRNYKLHTVDTFRD